MTTIKLNKKSIAEIFGQLIKAWKLNNGLLANHR